MKRLFYLAPLLVLGGCMVGPDYQRPEAPVETSYGSLPPDTWKQSRPSDAAAKGRWWEVYGIPELNKLEEQVSISNQNVLAAEALYRQARGAGRVAKSDLYPQAGSSPSAINSSGSHWNSSQGRSNETTYTLPASLSWEIDLWGGIRRNVEQNVATAQATEAQLENARLSYQTLLAQNYFTLRGLDAQIDLFERTIVSYDQYLTITRNQYKSGIASEAAVAQAEAQLESARVSLADSRLSRDQSEHAVAILVGQTPAAFHLAPAPLQAQPPHTPLIVPSDLLQRRPDIAQAERTVAAANAGIGVATAAYYPALTLNASAGTAGSGISSLLSVPSLFWSVGPSLSQSLFDAGRTHAQVYQARAGYDSQVATYRETVLTAFQQVEDDLTGLHFLELEARSQAKAVAASENSLRITRNQYVSGTASNLDVIVTENIALSNEQNAVQIAIRRMTTSVALIQALGGGWEAGQLPDAKAASTIPGNLLQQSPAAAAVTGQAH